MTEPGHRVRGQTLIRFGLGAFSLGLFLAIGCGSITLGVSNRIDPRGDLGTTPQALAPTKFTQRIAPYLLLSDFDLRKEKGLLDDLTRVRDQVSRQLQLPLSSAVIQVFLFDDKDRYKAYLQYHHKDQNLPDRRALFIAQSRALGARDDLLVYTYRTERLLQDLRHELTHALLHSVLREVPLWLDEGLAEYFELPPELKGINADHVRILLRSPGGPVRSDMARLEGLKEVRDMQPPEYREAWAWVHMMLHGKPEARKVLLTYLHQLKDTTTPGPLAPRLREVHPRLAEAFVEHLVRLEAEIAPGR